MVDIAQETTSEFRTEFVAAKLTPSQRRKLAELAKASGLSLSSTLAALVDAASVEPAITLKSR